MLRRDIARNVFRTRARIIRFLRDYLDALDFIEVIAGKFDASGTEALFQALQLSVAGDRHNPGTSGQAAAPAPIWPSVRSFDGFF